MSILFLPEAHTPIFLYQQRWKPSSQWSSKYLLQCLATICLWQNRPRTQHMVSIIGVLTNIDFKNDGTPLLARCDSNFLEGIIYINRYNYTNSNRHEKNSKKEMLHGEALIDPTRLDCQLFAINVRMWLIFFVAGKPQTQTSFNTFSKLMLLSKVKQTQKCITIDKPEFQVRVPNPHKSNQYWINKVVREIKDIS